MKQHIALARALAAGIALWMAGTAAACPFCSVTSQTLSEEMATADAVVLARLESGGIAPGEGPDALGGFGVVDPDTGSATFKVHEILKGKEHLIGVDTIKVVFFGPPEKDKLFMITGIGTEKLEWAIPLPLSDAAVDYLRQLPTIPTKGAERLAFFQDYFEHEDPLLAQDAYEEFARAPYAEVISLKERMHHDRLVEWITSPDVSPSRRRLYLTMLGVCGSDADLPMLEEMILSDLRQKEPIVRALVQAGLALGGPVSLPLVEEVVKADERRKKLGLDAMIACYLTLGGPEKLDAIDRRFLADPEVDYTHTYSTLMALRFHGEETDVVPKERLLESLRLLLKHPDFADQVIPDLARWEDWEILDELVDMFRDADARSFIRQPVVTYVIAASEQEGQVGERATAALAELTELDPETVKRAKSLMAFGFLSRSRPEGDAKNYTRAGSPYEENTETAATDNQQPATEDASDEIPDPSDPQFADEDAATAVADAPTDQEALDPDSAPTGDDEAATTAAAENQPDRQSVTYTETELRAPSALLVVGVPLAAAALLMGLFWFILRSGAG